MTLFTACLLTIAIETAFFLVLGYRDRAFVTVCICANAATNLTLNMTLPLLVSVVDITFWVYPLELLVLMAEYAVFALLLGRSRKLFLLTLAANALSYAAGLLLFGHV